MSQILTFIPFLISLLIGYFLIEIILKRNNLTPITHLSLAIGLGLGISGQLTFLSFLIFNQFTQWFIILINILALLTVLIINSLYAIKLKQKFLNHLTWTLKEFGCIAIIIIALIPLVLQAQFFPHGGWDAWSTWNLKAKFLLLGQTHWANMFDPVLWRSSPHYPLLLPSINAWGWSFHTQALPVTPLLTTLLFTFGIMGLMFDGIKTLTRSYSGLIAAIIPVALPLTIILIAGQYADVVVGYYILSAMICLIFAKKYQSLNFLILAALFLGCLSFVKGEGFLAALILIGLSIPFVFFKTKFPNIKKSLLIYSAVLCLSFLSMIIFSTLYTTDNQTFINGWTSQTHPITPDRLKITLAFYWFHFTSAKWNGLWIAVLGMLIVGWRKSFNKDIWIIPCFVLIYNAVIILYYCTNTHFEIAWWLQSSFARLAFAIEPIVLFWSFYAFWTGKNNQDI